MKKKRIPETAVTPLGDERSRSESVVFSDFTDQNKYQRNIKTLCIVGVILAILAVFVAVIVYRFFRVQSIVVDGISYYNYTTVLENTDLRKGQIIFTASEKKIRESLVAKLPHVHDVKVSLRLPSEVTVEIEEEVPAYYFEMVDEFFVISQEMKILDRFLSEDTLKNYYPDLMYITIPEVGRAITAERVQFTTEFASKHTDDVLYALRMWDRFDKITEIKLDNRFNLQICYEDRIKVELGSYTDFAGKLKLLETMIDYYDSSFSGHFSVRDVQNGIVYQEESD